MVMVISSPTTRTRYAEILRLILVVAEAPMRCRAHRIFDRRRRPIHIEHDFLGHAVNRQVACDLQLPAPAALACLE